MISGVVYDIQKLTMDIQFADKKSKNRDFKAMNQAASVGDEVPLPTGAIYRYRNINPTEFAMLVTSRSTGKMFNAVIRGKKFTKCRRTALA